MKKDWLTEIEDRHYAGTTTAQDVADLIDEVRWRRSDHRLRTLLIVVTAIVLAMIGYASCGVRVGIGGGGL